MDRVSRLALLVVVAAVGVCAAGCARMSESEWAGSLNNRLGPIGDGSGWTPLIGGEGSEGGVIAMARVASVLVRPEDSEYARAQIFVIVRPSEVEDIRELTAYLDHTGTGFTRSGGYSLDMSYTDLDGTVRECPNRTIRFPPMIRARWFSVVGIDDPNAVAFRIDRLVCRRVLDPRAVGLDLRIGVDEVSPFSWDEPRDRMRWGAPLVAHGVKGRNKHIGGRRWIRFEIGEP
ncbi:MAG: hypothetical protein JJU33_12630 [Phycisphaerales bacterium]|nr:hypothetical protein [Phycisphaerales bacterium]